MNIFDRIKKFFCPQDAGGDYFWDRDSIYHLTDTEKMKNDPQVKACLNIKKMLVLQGEQEIHPKSDSKEDIKRADFLRDVLYRSEDTVTDMLYSVLDAFCRGFSLCEIVYRKLPEGKIGIEKFVPVNPMCVTFDYDDFGNLKAIKVNGQACRRDKLILYTYGGEFGSPYGKSDLLAAKKHFAIKEKLTEYYNVYLEKYASPLIWGTYGKHFTPENQQAFFDSLKNVRQKTAVVTPEECHIDTLNLNTGGGDSFQKAIDYHDRQIAKAILGQTIFTNDNVTVGSYSLANIHLELLAKCLNKIKKDLCESVMEEQVLKPLTRLNFGDEDCPKFSIKELNADSLKKNSDAMSSLIKNGIITGKEVWLKDFLGLPEK